MENCNHVEWVTVDVIWDDNNQVHSCIMECKMCGLKKAVFI